MDNLRYAGMIQIRLCRRFASRWVSTFPFARASRDSPKMPPFLFFLLRFFRFGLVTGVKSRLCLTEAFRLCRIRTLELPAGIWRLSSCIGSPYEHAVLTSTSMQIFVSTFYHNSQPLPSFVFLLSLEMFCSDTPPFFFSPPRPDIGNLHPKVSVADLEPKLIKYGTITNLWVAKNPPGMHACARI